MTAARWFVDTSVLVDHLRGDPRAVALLSGAVAQGRELWSATVVRVEVLAGARRSEEAATLRLLDQLHWTDLTTEIADAAGRLAQTYLRSHSGVDTVDYIIAASSLHLGADLKTLNVKHFPMLKGLEKAYS